MGIFKNRRLSINHVIVGLTLFISCAGAFFPKTISMMIRHQQSPLAIERIVNLGDVPKGKSTTRILSLFNPHLTSVHIKNVVTTCGCTTADVSPPLISPLRASTIVVSIKPMNQGQGSESIELTTNRGTQQISVEYNAV